jgi:hypothetical protein
MKKELAGTYAKVVFDIPVNKLIDIVTYKGIAHHVIMGYVQYRKAVSYFARIMGWETIDENASI